MFKTIVTSLVALTLLISCSRREVDPPSPPISLSGPEVAFLRSHVVTVGYPRYAVPLAFQNQKGDAAGSGPAFIRLIAKKTGLRVQFIAYETQAQSLEAFKRHETDIALPVKDVPERRDYMAFTQPYMLVNSVMLVHELPIKFPMQVGFGGKFAIQSTLEKLGKQVQIRPYPRDELAFQALMHNELGAVVLDVQGADYLEHKYSVRFARSPVDFVYDLAFGFQKDNMPLGSILSKGLVNMSTQEKLQIQQDAIDPVMASPPIKN
jgi:ABC-type amino acid transport substrate-binding protein